MYTYQEWTDHNGPPGTMVVRGVKVEPLFKHDVCKWTGEVVVDNERLRGG